MYVRGSLGCLVVSEYNVSKSFESTIDWKNRVEEYLKLSAEPTNIQKIPIVLVQNKIDMMLEDPLIQQKEEAELKSFGEEHKFDKTFQTSAKFNINLKQAFNYLTEEIIKRGLIKDFSINYDIKRIFLKKADGNLTDNDNCRC
jgi:GTPase SAR1 family protein